MFEMLTSFGADVVCSATDMNDISLCATTVLCPPELRALNTPLIRTLDDLRKYHPTIAANALCETLCQTLITDEGTVAEAHEVTLIQRSIVSVGIAGDAQGVTLD